MRGFNVAASIKMRKFHFRPIRPRSRPCVLQCGRIYKDAEIEFCYYGNDGSILSFNVAASIKMRKFDASVTLPQLSFPLQCGRIYKDAEIAAAFGAAAFSSNCFNVAASIKMRKLGVPGTSLACISALQCGRIYKDAEIKRHRARRVCACSPSMWPHL